MTKEKALANKILLAIRNHKDVKAMIPDWASEHGTSEMKVKFMVALIKTEMKAKLHS